jgi:hypothetical protein
LANFDEPDKLAIFHPGASQAGVRAPGESATHFPEIWATTPDVLGKVIVPVQVLPGPTVQFVVCMSCKNITMSLRIDEQTFFTRDEAGRVCRDEGFTFVRESLINPALAAETLDHVRRSEAEYRKRPESDYGRSSGDS